MDTTYLDASFIKETEGADKFPGSLPQGKQYRKPQPLPQITVERPDGTTFTRTAEWWEAWADKERYRSVIGYDPNMARSNRFHLAVSDFMRFTSEHYWPKPVRLALDQLRIFAGLLTIIPVWWKKGDHYDDDPGSDFDSDEEGGAKKVEVTRGIKQTATRRKRHIARAPYGDGPNSFSPVPKAVDNDEQIQELLQQAKEEKEGRLIEFLNDVERSVRFFLSGYFRRQGFQYYKENLFVYPKLTGIFLDFMIHHRAFPDFDDEQEARKARELVNTALTELPLTEKLAKTLPGPFSIALSSSFTEQLPCGSPSMTADSPLLATPKASFHVLDGKEDHLTGLVDNEDLQDAGVFSPDQRPAHAFSEEETFILRKSVDATDFESELLPLSPSVWDADPWQDAWSYEQPTLFTFMGPTALPMSHQIGVVEWSVRRVEEITPPSDSISSSSKAYRGSDDGDSYGNAISVEAELSRKFYKVKLVPWIGWEEGKFPHILESSMGKVLIEDNVVFEGDTQETNGVMNDEDDPHKALTDPITVLMEELSVQNLRLGMGLGGTWAQLARCKDQPSDGKKPSERFWFIMDHMETLTSYHTV